ncbi:hypothetical protein AcV5_007517 [Taiwanofungus camphoratus]|nr:hypothetical protein AcV5_007517 [Antrodia cinnamomea]
MPMSSEVVFRLNISCSIIGILIYTYLHMARAIVVASLRISRASVVIDLYGRRGESGHKLRFSSQVSGSGLSAESHVLILVPVRPVPPAHSGLPGPSSSTPSSSSSYPLSSTRRKVISIYVATSM